MLLINTLITSIVITVVCLIILVCLLEIPLYEMNQEFHHNSYACVPCLKKKRGGKEDKKEASIKV